jgi:hypothetical protein
MQRILSIITATILWLAFLYVAATAVFLDLLPHLLGWEVDFKLVLYLALDAVILQILAFLYQILPHKPKNIAFMWLEKVWLF